MWMLNCVGFICRRESSRLGCKATHVGDNLTIQSSQEKLQDAIDRDRIGKTTVASPAFLFRLIAFVRPDY